MTETTTQGEPGAQEWDALSFEAMPTAEEAFVVDIDGFEGPLDLLLALARTQKVDLSKISILALVEQYLGFIAGAQQLKLEIAADYLVMAAWLAFLKSRLLLPKEKDDADTASAEEMAQRLAFRLMRLDAMREKAATLFTRRRLDKDVFARGQPERVRVTRDTTYTATIYDLLKAYADQRKRTIKVVHVVKMRRVWSIKEARMRLQKLVGATEGDWAQLDLFLEQYLPRNEEERSALASSFGATLEMAREGLIELRQDEPFAPIYMRKREAGAEWEKIG
ncbi:ScpA family protein [Hyphomicrobium sp.]|jgi:segregation and condensation protein A|uniref:segregation and condensation protein A n=1 Tax=Hyphomicrobium sp. TaxID=82 RepID=UPI002C48A75E|nr:ScpA family protein [Hyphomicrobium sp.]HVZ04262.1 ScpA family protein [Hyphomicrobium sp.]